MQQRVAIITLGVSDLQRTKYFYIEGFGWKPIVEDNETLLFQMNGFILSTWLKPALEKDINNNELVAGGSITLAHNVTSPDQVQNLLNRLSTFGGQILRNADEPAHGGVRGYISDPDNHIWEIIFNTIWKMDEKGCISFSK